MTIGQAAHNVPQTTPNVSPQLAQRAQALRMTHGDVQGFCAAYPPVVQGRCADNPVRAITGNAPRLSAVKAAWAGGAQTWLMLQIFDLNEYAGNKDKMSGTQAEQCADIIARDFGYLRVTELMLFFQRVKSGKFGKFYGGVDAITLCAMLREWVRTERSRVVEEQEQRHRQAMREVDLRQVIADRQKAAADGRNIYEVP